MKNFIHVTYIDYLWLEELWIPPPVVELRIPIAPEPPPEKPGKKKPML